MAEWTLRQARYFLTVVDAGSLAGGAALSSVAQATVSTAVAQLESALGVDLLVRGPARRAIPTAAGREFAIRARAILDLVDSAGEAASERGDELRGDLSIGSVFPLSPRLLPGLAYAFATRWPDVRLRMDEAGPMELQQRVREGTLDVALVYARQADAGVVTHLIAPVRMHAMISADHPLAERAQISVRDLLPLPVILPDLPPSPDRLMMAMAEIGIRPEVRWRFTSQETIRGLVSLGLGFSLVNSVPSSGTTFDGRRVAYVALSDPFPENAIVACTAAGRHPSRRLSAALAVTRELVAEEPPPADGRMAE